MIEIIKRPKNEEQTKEQIKGLKAQISYNSDGHLAIRLLQHDGDTLIVLGESVSDKVIRFCQKQLKPIEEAF
ncbi:MAG: hypothetical protein AB2448_01685 [Moorella sp. (in: firmicutes)]